MTRKRPSPLALLLLIGILTGPGCASITRRTAQIVPVTSSPVGAAVYVDGRPQGVTPLEVRLARKRKGQVIRIESPGYDPIEIRPQRKRPAGPVVGNILLGFAAAVIPAAVFWERSGAAESDLTLAVLGLGTAGFGALFSALDASGGQAYDLRPTDLTVTLKKTEGPPHVQVLFIEAEELWNIRWIRVHGA